MRLVDLLYVYFQFYKRSVRKEYEQHRDEEVNTVNKYKIIMEKYFFQDPKKIGHMPYVHFYLFGQNNPFSGPRTC